MRAKVTKLGHNEFIDAVKNNINDFTLAVVGGGNKCSYNILYRGDKYSVYLKHPYSITINFIEAPSDKYPNCKYRGVFYTGEDEMSINRAFHDLCIHYNTVYKDLKVKAITKAKVVDDEPVIIPIEKRKFKIGFIYKNIKDKEDKVIARPILSNISIATLDESGNPYIKKVSTSKTPIDLPDIGKFIQRGSQICSEIVPSIFAREGTLYFMWKFSGAIIAKEPEGDSGLTQADQDECQNAILQDMVRKDVTDDDLGASM